MMVYGHQALHNTRNATLRCRFLYGMKTPVFSATGAHLFVLMRQFVLKHTILNILKDAPPTFKSTDAKGKDLAGLKYTMQIAPEDCTGCGLCVENCPTKGKGNAIVMEPQTPLREQEAKNWEFFLSIPETDPKKFDKSTVKGSQLIRPLFEFSGACGGCGETAYVKLLTQLFGDRAYIANATGCSSIYGAKSSYYSLLPA